MARPIGGFLPLRLPIGPVLGQSVISAWVDDGASVWLLHNARSALNALWRATKPPRVWLPAYVCGELARSVPDGVEARFYPLDDTLSPLVDFLSTRIRDPDHVLAIDYFGRPVSPDLIALIRARPAIGWIEDRAQALDPATEPWGDWVLYSPRKIVGVADGGILVGRTKCLPPLTTTLATDFSFVLPVLERFEDIDETENARWYSGYAREEAAMRVGLQSMSRLSLAVLQTSNIRTDGEIRRRNFEVLHGRLREWAFLPDSKISYAPLGFPLRVKSPSTLADRLSKQRIYAARHWQSLPSDPATFAVEHRLAGELLTLPCDYRYGEADMRRVADAVLRSI